LGHRDKELTAYLLLTEEGGGVIRRSAQASETFVPRPSVRANHQPRPRAELVVDPQPGHVPGLCRMKIGEIEARKRAGERKGHRLTLPFVVPKEMELVHANRA